MQRPGAVEHISKGFGPALDGTATAIFDLNPFGRLTRRQDPCGNHLQLTGGDHSRDDPGDLRSNSVAVHVPPGPRVTEEAALLVAGYAVPQRVAVRAQAIDSRPPADLGASPSEPAEHRAQPTRKFALVDRRWIEICVSARDQAAPRQRDDPALVTG